MNVVLSLVATGVSLAFAAVVFRQYLDRTRPYQLVWSVALLIFAVGTLCQFLAEMNGWTPLIYRVWYFSGAMLSAAYLGQGTVYLMAPRKPAHVSMLILGFVSLIGLGLISVLPVDLSKALVGSSVTGNGFPTTLLIILIPLNTYGTLTLVGGALWSVFRFWRKGTMGRRTIGTFLIAAGGMTVALGGTANRLGIPGLLYITELIGIAVIFVGYLQTVAPVTHPKTVTETRSLTDNSRPSSAQP